MEPYSFLEHEEKKIIANAIVNEGINTSPVRITGTYKYDDETLKHLHDLELMILKDFITEENL